ncbi:hypothetical protein [Paraburkholderia azotifigens]|uniref:Uncharacterized protein n=1 Tax=Paraburkholderia azotifigens TaxID=2057004 RepID=A0A5C6VTX2_9BURK|nr:hypothetical protein [Paraburkholderia azotifigens]TXC88389.1 hypothetical protein FRZ40_12790 [Paraburkholderia azotifigens]
MTVQNNHFTTQLQNIARPAATDKTSSHSASASASTSTTTAAPTGAGAAPAPAAPTGLVGNHVNTTA